MVPTAVIEVVAAGEATSSTASAATTSVSTTTTESVEISSGSAEVATATPSTVIVSLVAVLRISVKVVILFDDNSDELDPPIANILLVKLSVRSLALSIGIEKDTSLASQPTVWILPNLD